MHDEFEFKRYNHSMCSPDGNVCYIIGGTQSIAGARDDKQYPITVMDFGSMEIKESKIMLSHRENPVLTKLTPMFMIYGYGYR